MIFQKKQKPLSSPSVQCIIATVESTPLMKGELLSPAGAPTVQIRVTQGTPEDALECGVVKIIPQSDIPPMLGRVTKQRDCMLLLDPLPTSGAALRANLRIPVDFLTYAYPKEGGRVAIRADDLSSGGIAFYCTRDFELKSLAEVVIPVTDPEPLILLCRILRKKTHSDSVFHYGCQFVDIIHDEESRVREAVFNMQLQNKN